MPRKVLINDEVVLEHDLTCPECGAPLWLKPSRFGLFYGCSTWKDTQCPGGHGAHKDGTPLGIPANKETKDARKAAHHVFDHLWKTGMMSRTSAYLWMQGAMGMSAKEAHIGRFTRDQCKEMVLKFRDEFPDLWKQIRGSKA